uniref:PlsC domain-containing protein n=1 Tax=Steinernema glaseri TaxID=37863 RepID=A0A1I7YPN3_9BILA
MGLMEIIFGVKVTVTGDKVDHADPALMIMNHRTRLDWLFYWNCLFRMDPWLLISEKITLKGILRFVPGAGWAMGSNAYLFLQRSFIEDKSRITKMLEYYAKTGDSYQVLLFPEGTDKCPIATARMIQFAEEKQLKQYEYVLHPKTGGFVLMVQKMRELGYIKYLYDVTVAYNDAIVQSEVDLIKLGATPKQVHFDVRKISIGDLPASDEGLAQWLTALWKEKEERLRRFYTQPIEKRMLDTHADSEIFELKENSRIIQTLIVVAWVFVTAFWSYFWCFYPLQGFWFLFVFSVFVGAQYAYGGIEWLAINASQWRENKVEQSPARAAQ